MSLLKVKARVALVSEEYLDAELLEDLDSLSEEAKQPYVAWRKITVRSEEIKEVVQFDKDKSLIITYLGERYLVKEPHASVHKKWQDANEYEDRPEPHSKQEAVEAEEAEDDDDEKDED